jgi:hypothetical protein
MTTWSSAELARIGQAEELQVAPTRPDGAERPYVIAPLPSRSKATKATPK